MRAPFRIRSRVSRVSVALSLVVLLPLLVSACGAESEPEETDQHLEEAGEQLEQAGESLGESLQEAGENASREAGEAAERLEPVLEDAELTARVKTRLAAHPDVNPFYIDVDTVGGTVTLTGEVPSESQREEALEVARKTDGVVEVVDNLQVGPRD